MYEQPTIQDWIYLQGGMPTVLPRNEYLVDIFHDYPQGEGMIVPTRIPIEAMGSVLYEIAGRYVEFPVAMIRALHGTPCERTSLRNGGSRYSRA